MYKTHCDSANVTQEPMNMTSWPRIESFTENQSCYLHDIHRKVKKKKKHFLVSGTNNGDPNSRSVCFSSPLSVRDRALQFCTDPLRRSGALRSQRLKACCIRKKSFIAPSFFLCVWACMCVCVCVSTVRVQCICNIACFPVKWLRDVPYK